MALRSPARWSQYLREAYATVARIRWITHAWTMLAGNTAATASGRPLSPSQTTKNTSCTPRFFRSLSTFIQYFADSPPPAPAHSPRTSRRPAKVDSDGGVERAVADLAVADLDVDRVEK